MPSPIAHLAYGQRLTVRRPELAAEVFARGTIFPDIRYLAQIDRAVTHQEHQVELGQVLAEPNAWRAGYLFHNWLDDAWNEQMAQHGLEEHNANHALTWAALKVLEERLARSQIREANQLAESLVVVDDEAVAFGVAAPVVKRWGELVRDELMSPWLSPHWDQFIREAIRQDDVACAKLRQRVAELEAEGIWLPRLEECWRALVGRLSTSFESR
ncbi:MAG TPA: hypothetical protein VLI05_03175 [Candidatus Saccharimonadia bacterium]|nr:hypothetical protein [Candidatus Saccharimonadia bacterium]